MPAALLLFAGAALLRAADTTDYVILNHGRPAGEMRVIATGDSVTVRYGYQDRQRGPHFESRYLLASDGSVRRMEYRGQSGTMVPAAASEWYERTGDSARWVSVSDSGRVKYVSGAVYRLGSTTPYDDAMLARALMRLPQRSAPLLPEGTAKLEIVADTSITVHGTPRRLRLAMLDVGGTEPGGVWLDDRGDAFASDAGWFIAVRKGAEDALPALKAIEAVYHAKRSAALAATLAPATASALVIRNGDLFDSERGSIVKNTTVVIRGDRIVAVGPASSTPTPAGATVIDATGKTVMPGMWDMHTHLGIGGETSNGAMQLAAGLTTVRDVASDIDEATSQRARAVQGTLLKPRLILAGFIEGPGKWAGPTSVLVRTEDEARAWVARYDSLGYRQIKLYNLVHPDLVPTIAEEAHRRGMRLSGHVPRGLTVPDAIRLGFDEINHSAFLFSTFFQDSLYVPTMRAYSSVAAAVAPTFDVNAPQMTTLIGFLRERGTVIDGTFNIWGAETALADGADPVLGPTVSWLPPAMQRRFGRGAPGTPQETARAEASAANYRRLLKRLYDAGITLVAGTDNTAGLSFHGELEIYERAGIPAPAVLQIATIIPARVMKDDANYGSVSVGKIADLVIVDGHPAQHVRDLRRTEQVVRAGKVYRARDLYAAAGITQK
jgi:hypothetical protein